jgi:hypothetical protein
MSDVYKARDEDQVGLLAFIGGKPAGVDMVSLMSAYAKLLPTLVRSYTLEGLLDDKAKPAPADGLTSRAKEFPAEIANAEERHENEVIHAAFFRLDETEKTERMASIRRRRHYRE